MFEISCQKQSRNELNMTSDVPEMHPKFGDDCSLTPETVLPPGLKLYCRAKGLLQGTQEFVDNLQDFRV